VLRSYFGANLLVPVLSHEPGMKFLLKCIVPKVSLNLLLALFDDG
jgi:hypothetical protein